MSHALFVAWSFPPSRSSGVYRALAIPHALLRAGWDVTVLTAPREVFVRNSVADLSLEPDIDPRLNIVRVPFSASGFDTDLLSWDYGRARFPEFWQARHNRSGLRAFPEAEFGGWAKTLRAAAEKIHAAKPVDVTIGTAAPYVDFVPGSHLHERFGVPYVMDYRDAWTVDVFRGTDSATATTAQREWERRAIADAHQVWFVNQPIRDWHAERHPSSAEKMRVVPNGFDRPDGGLGVPWRPVDKGMVFGYLGTIHAPQFPGDVLVAGWKRARELDPRLADARLELHGHIGRSPDPSPAITAWLSAAEAEAITYEGPVPRSEVKHVYDRFDALVLALASGPGVTSGKVYEYAATGLPIVSVHERDSAASTLLRNNPVWAPSEELTPEGVAAAFMRGADIVLAQSPETRAAAITLGEQWERGKLLDPHVAALTESLGARKS